MYRWSDASTVKQIVLIILIVTCGIGGYDYCQSPNPGSQKLFCMGLEHEDFSFGAGQGCLSKSSCSLIISGRNLYSNSSWFKVYIPINKESTQIDVYLMITKHEVTFARDSEVTKKLGIRDTMIAKGEARSNGTLHVYSYKKQKDRKKQDTKIDTSSSFYSFAPDRKSTRMRQAFGTRNYTVFAWRTSEFLTEGAETFNFHRLPVRVTLRLALETLTSLNLAIVRVDRHMLFGDPIRQHVSGRVEHSAKRRDEL